MDFNVRPVPGAMFSTAPAEWLLNEMECPQQGSILKSISICFEYSDGTAEMNTYTLQCAPRLWGRRPDCAHICTRTFGVRVKCMDGTHTSPNWRAHLCQLSIPIVNAQLATRGSQLSALSSTQELESKA